MLNANCTTKRPLVLYKTIAKMLENTDGTITIGHSREIGNTVHTRQRKTKQTNNTTCIGDHYAHPNTDGMNIIF